jgi:hypothetical protein
VPFFGANPVVARAEFPASGAARRRWRVNLKRRCSAILFLPARTLFNSNVRRHLRLIQHQLFYCPARRFHCFLPNCSFSLIKSVRARPPPGKKRPSNKEKCPAAFILSRVRRRLNEGAIADEIDCRSGRVFQFLAALT